MSIFQTPRPTSPDMELNKVVGLKNARRANRMALQEAAQVNKEAEETKKLLDAEDAKDEAKKESDKALASLEAKRVEQLKARAIATLESRLLKEQVPEIFNQVVFEMAYNAFWLDDAVKESSDIHAMYESFNQIKNVVAEIMPVGETQFIKNAREVIQEACKKKATEISDEFIENKKCKSLSDLDEIDFSLSDDENIKLDDSLSELGKDEIEQLVKDKVLSVIQDERRASEQKQEAFKQVDDALNSLEMTKDEVAADGTTTESVNPLAMMQARTLRKKLNLMTETSSLFEAVMMHSNKTISEEATTEGVQVTNEAMATAVFTDAVFTYTVLETLNTIGLYKFDAINTKKLIKKLQTM